MRERYCGVVLASVFTICCNQQVAFDGGAPALEVSEAGGTSGAGGQSTKVVVVEPATGNGGAGVEPDVVVEPSVAPDAGLPASCSLSFASASGYAFSATDDQDSDCANGVQVGLELYVEGTVPDGSEVLLSIADAPDVVAVITESVARFTSLTLAPGAVVLSAQLSGDDSCRAVSAATVECVAPPPSVDCALTGIAAGDVFSGVPVVDDGPRVSPKGAPYQAKLTVVTSLPDGALVTLGVDGEDNAAVAAVVDGQAVFASAPLGQDGEHALEASCVSAAGTVFRSAVVAIVVDTNAPAFDLLPPLDMPAHHFSPGDDLDLATEILDFDVCIGAEELADADGLCVRIDGGAPSCASLESDGAGAGAIGGCVRLSCPGSAPFELNVSLTDPAGNISSRVLPAVTCASSAPTVRIANLADASDAPAEIERHLLSASSSVGLVDQDALSPGAQYDVVACTNATAGQAELFLGLEGDIRLAGAPLDVTAAEPADGCEDLGYVARFEQVTIPESLEEQGELSVMSQLRVYVTDVTTERGSSPLISLWVDSVAPSLTVSRPIGGICGVTFRQVEELETEIAFTAGAFPVLARLNGEPDGGMVFSADSTLVGVSESLPLTFPLGVNWFSAEVTEPSGNRVTLNDGEPCEVLVGEPPVVTWLQPATNDALGAGSDGDADVAGWQGTLEVAVAEFDAASNESNVTFYYDLGDGLVELGSAPVVGDAGGGTATLEVTLPEAAEVILSAAMDSVGVFEPKPLPISLGIDVTRPGLVGVLDAIEVQRRAANYRLEWAAATDSGSVLADYEVYWSTAPITEDELSQATEVDFDGDVSANPAGMVVRSLPMETGLYFAVRAVDAGGNRGQLRSTESPERSEFRVSILEGEDATVLGSWVDGTADIIGGRLDPMTGQWLQGDGVPDLMVGSWSGEARIYRGIAREDETDASPLFDLQPTLTISGNPSGLFGERIVAIGDVNADGMEDFAASGTYDGPHGQGAVFVWFGRAPSDNSGTEWPAQLSSASANVVIQTSGTDAWAGDCPTCTNFGQHVVRLGDFDGDGIDDFAIAAHRAGTEPLEGGFVGVVLGSTSLPPLIEMAESPNAAPPAGVISIPGVTLDGRSGTGLVGMGPFFGPGGNGVAVAVGNAEEMLSFNAFQASLGLIESPVHRYAGTDEDRNDYGRVSTALGGNRFAVASPCASYFFPCVGVTAGFVDVFFGSQDPFAAKVTITTSAVDDLDFGVSVLGSAVATTAALRPLPLVGDLTGNSAADSDFAIVDQGVSADNPAIGPRIFLFSGQSLQEWIATGVATRDVAAADSTAMVISIADKTSFDFETRPWAGTAALSLPVADMNDDGFAELVVSEFGAYDAIFKGEGTLSYPGRVVVLW